MGQTQEERLQELTDKLENGIKELFASGRYAEYLAAMSKFHHYSFGNVVLILLQCPTATKVAGYNRWKKDFGRQVKKRTMRPKLGRKTKRGDTLQPTFSPWGEVDWCETLCPGFEMVATPSHGGIMVERIAAMRLSVTARKCGFWEDGYLCFEEDSQENVVLRELLDKGMWQLPDRIRNPIAFEENINRNIQEYNPEYWSARQRWYRKREQAKAAPQKVRPATVR